MKASQYPIEKALTGCQNFWIYAKGKRRGIQIIQLVFKNGNSGMNGKGRLGEQEVGNRKKAEGFIYIVFCRASSLSYSGDNTLMSFKEPFFLYKSEFFLLQ